MQALVLDKPHSFRYEGRPMPVPRRGEVLLRVDAVAVCGSDIHAINGAMSLFSFPRVLGHEIAATIVESNHCSSFRPGEKVCVMPTIFCGKCIACRQGKTNCCASLKLYGVQVDGGLQEYMAVPGEKLLRAPQGKDDDVVSLSLVEPLAIGEHAISRVAIAPGERVLVLGAGPIGVCCALMAQARGAQVILVDVNAERAGFVTTRFGFPILNPLADDYAHAINERTDGELFHAVLDTTANKRSMDNAHTLIGNGGRIVFVGIHKGMLEIDETAFHMKEPLLTVTRNSTARDFECVLRLWEEEVVNPCALATNEVSFVDAIDVLPAWASGKEHLFKGIVRMYNDR